VVRRRAMRRDYCDSVCAGESDESFG
jgi:hypothetical protein